MNTTVSRRSIVAALIALATLALTAQAQAQTPPNLHFSWDFTVPGDYAIAGVDVTGSSVNGFVSGTITMAGVPPNADILAAYLYWETITLDADPTQARGVTFRGVPIDIDNLKMVKRRSQTLTGQTASCWSAGQPLAMSMFRADVLGLLPLKRDTNGNYTGKRLVNTADLPPGDPGHIVSLPSFGTGNQVPESAGASLVVVYRNPDPDRTTNPVRRIVAYDGIHIQLPGEVTSWHLHGIFGSAATKSARITQMAASGQKNSTEHMYFNGYDNAHKIAGEPNLPEPFPDAATSSERGWANPTFTVSQLMPGSTTNDPSSPDYRYGETLTTTVDHKKTSPYECLSWGGVIVSAAMADVDQDGLSDAVEDAPAGTPLLAPGNGQPLPDLHAMGATSQHKDLFVEINTMKTSVQQTYGSTQYPYDSSAYPSPIISKTMDPHTHMPTPLVLRYVAEAHANAPVNNPDGTTGIRVHYDVGNVAAYHALPPVQHLDWVDDYSSPEADQYIIGAGPTASIAASEIRGGETIEEKACVPGPDPVTGVMIHCQFTAFPGTAGFKYHLERFRDAPVDDNGNQISAADIAAWKAGAAAPFLTHRHRLDRNRKGFFRLGVFVHSRGRPKSPLPCLDASGTPTRVGYDPTTGYCTTMDNPDFHVPSTSSGVADLGGYNFMVAHGGWPDFAKPFVRANTMFHEMGHLSGLWHGGPPPFWGDATHPMAVEPNCKPNLPTSMSYSHQIHGLFNDINPDPQLDYSRGVFGATNGSPLDEAALYDLPNGLGLTGSVTIPSSYLYRPAWYAPFNPAGAQSVTKYCGGPLVPSGEPAIGRFEALGATTPIIWGSAPAQDINNDGCKDGTCVVPPAYPFAAPLTGYDEWANLRLDLIGMDRRLARFTTGGGDGDFGGGDGDFGGGQGDFGGGDGDFGGGDGDFGGGDGDFGGGDGDFGGGDGDFGGGAAELDLQTAKDLGRTPPYAVSACVLGATCVSQPQPKPFDATYHTVQVQWKSPLLGHPNLTGGYRLYRINGDSITPQTITDATLVAEISGTQLSYNDTTELPNGYKFTYFLRAVFDDDAQNTISSPSNFATITAVNDAPVANNDTYSTATTSIGVAAPGVLCNDRDDDTDNPNCTITPPTSQFRAVLVTGPSNGTLALGGFDPVTNSFDGSFTYTEGKNFPGKDTFTYKANDGWFMFGTTLVPISPYSNTVTVTIQQKKTK